MALTPEDVVNKRFQPTKFREGYDQDEVDDFLDEVVVELRRLGQENEELRQRLSATESRPQESPTASAQAAPVQAAMAQAATGQTATEPAAAEQAAASAAPEPVAAPAAGFSGGDSSLDPNNTNNLLQLARRLHEEHVREGIEKRDALIAEGHAAAARIVSDAETQQRTQLTSLEQERAALEGRIEELRSFEREYRAKLRGHLEGILHDLDDSGATVGASAQPAAHQQPTEDFGTMPAQPQGGYPGYGGN